MISYGLSRGFYPKLLGEWKNGNKEKASHILRNSIKNYLFIGLPAATGMYILSNSIGTLFISNEYAKGYPIIGIVAFGMFFLALAEYANKEWELSGNTKPIFKNSLKAAILNLILNIIFIPMFGFIAAAYTTCFSFFVYAIICFMNRKKEITYRLEVKELLGIILSTVIMAFTVLICGLLPFKGLVLLISQVVAGIVSYMMMIFILNVYSIKKLLHHEESVE
jgi:O-antigen/teichoic acid export membrane protein